MNSKYKILLTSMFFLIFFISPLFAMTILVKKLTGQTISLDVNANDTIAMVKQKIYARELIPPDLQDLTYQGKILNAGTVSENGIKKESTLFLSLRLRGR